jgi:acetyl-CoA acetyltransferase
MPAPLVVSYGSSTYEKRDGHELLWHLWQAASTCLDRAGLAPRDLDGLTLASFSYPPGNVVTLGEHFGLRLRWAEQGVFGGASGVVALGHAAAAIRAGWVRAVLCLAGDAFTVASHDDMLGSFTPAMRDYLAPHGFGGANGLFALVQCRHAHLYGTTREQLGNLAVTLRSHALLNPNALFTEPLTLDDYLSARWICEPLGLFDCVMPCSGAEAVLLVSDDVARALDRPAVRILSFGEAHNAHPDAVTSLQGGFELFADDLFQDAGVPRSAVDLLGLYDDYPIMVGIQLERLGFCSTGACGPFLASTDVSISGELPINTGGGQLSCGQSGAGGGTIAITEAVCQLHHEAGERQVANAEIALVSGFGLVSYGKGLSTAGVLLGRGS